MYRVAILILALLATPVSGFSLSPVNTVSRTELRMTESATEEEIISSKTTAAKALRVPLTWDEMVRQAASAVKDAARDGQTRQIVRVLVPRDSRSGDFGKYAESDAGIDLENALLVPPDESWQGGIMQLYRAGSPTCSALVRKVTEDNGLPSRVTEDRSVEESGVDGVGLFQTDDRAVACWLQPTQEIIDDVVDICVKDSDDQVRILMNPQWRQVDDALDTASQGEGFLSGLASFLGGKGGTLKRLSEAGFKPVYNLEGYVCRGSNVRLLQVRDSDWAVFCERDDGESFISVGTSPSRPTYQEVDEMLTKSNIGYKYARDIGMAPKL